MPRANDTITSRKLGYLDHQTCGGGWGERQHRRAYSLSRLGQLQRAEVLFQGAIELESAESDRSNLGACMVGLADVEMQLGRLGLAKEHYEACIQLCEESRLPVLKGVAHRDYCRLFAIQGLFSEALAQNDLALEVFESLQADQPAEPAWKEHIGLTLAHRAWTLLMAGDRKIAVDTARRARVLADAKGYAFDVLLTEWLLGAALIATDIEEAQQHLNDALGRSQRMSAVRIEPAILLDLARAHEANNNFDEAEGTAGQALCVADRCGFRLLQADLHNLLSRLQWNVGDSQGARQHADSAGQFARCEGGSLCYRSALDQSVALLAQASRGT